MRAMLYISTAMTAVGILVLAAVTSISAQTWCVVAAVVALVGSTGFFTWSLCGRKHEDFVRGTITVCRMFFGIFVGGIVAGLVLLGVYAYGACAKHMSASYWSDHGIAEVVSHVQSTPDSADSIEKGDLVVFYKFGCPDCDAVYADADKLAAESGTTLKWVSTDTDLGHEFAEEHGIDWTPTGVYMLNEKIGETEIIQMRIDKTENGQTVLDADALSNLIEYQQKGK